MPTYEYECASCAHRFEVFQKMSDKPARTCPQCGKKKVRRLIGSGGGLLFKGSGFYITDYRSEAYKSSAKADAAAPPAKESKSASASDAGAGKKSSKA